MKTLRVLKIWLVSATFAVIVSSCATTQDEIIEDGGPIQEDQSSMEMSSSSGITDSGASASGLQDGEDGSMSAIVEPMGAAEMLQQTEGDLANRTIYFEFDSATLTDESIRILEAHGNFIAGNGEVKVRLEGHADERGSREYNIGLGDRRAQSVRRVLLFQGAATGQVDTVSYGEERPVDDGHDESAWAKNRRVELIYTVN